MSQPPKASVEASKPPKLYKHGQLVAVKTDKDELDGVRDFRKKFGTTNGVIVGYEWGEHASGFLKPIWCCWVRPDNDPTGEAMLVPESNLSRITR